MHLFMEYTTEKKFQIDGIEGQVNRMREIKVKVPDETVYMHVVIGVNENGCMMMYTCSNDGKHDIEIGEGEQNA